MDVAPVAARSELAEDVPTQRALETANYLARVWSDWLRTDNERRKRSAKHYRASEDLPPEFLAHFTPEPLAASVLEPLAASVLDFTAIDFETANSYRGSPCSVGLVKVRNGAIVDERHWLIRPPEGADWFDAFNIGIHGITPSMVADAPRWSVVLPQIMAFVDGDVVVAHNAGFDIGVIRYACAVDNIEWPAIDFLCTLVLARRAFSLPSYRLPFVTEACGVVLERHHDALADARAVVDVIRGMALLGGTSDLRELAARHLVRIGRMESGIYAGSVSTASGSGSLVAADANPHADPAGYLYGRVVVFTGALMSMNRQAAWDQVVRSGGAPELNTTKRTNILVLGDFNPANLRPGATYSGKARKAFDLQDKGQDIELMTEADFVRVLDGGDFHVPDMN
ncbi:exonuclease [Aeromicrobium ginsengisoli]|uniref:Exonuclease n=2 Tax=Aeromicrobium ginsengisoli TaxID=363867 RepID=A0A5M4FCT3_9ACTN|nr:exonuclease [Aeromicrobium ginsengisoli]